MKKFQKKIRILMEIIREIIKVDSQQIKRKIQIFHKLIITNKIDRWIDRYHFTIASKLCFLRIIYQYNTRFDKGNYKILFKSIK